MIKVAPSILSADFARLGEEVLDIRQGGADYVHFDVMDGLFVPNLSIGIPVLKSLRHATDLFLDVHLMIERPLRYTEDFCRAGADLVDFHVESDSEDQLLTAISTAKGLGVKTAVALKPGTPAEAARPFLALVDMILVMTVEPGFGGQSFMTDQLPKITALRKWLDQVNPACELEVDGGVDEDTAALAVKAGANVLVAGSAVFGKEDRSKAIAAIRNI